MNACMACSEKPHPGWPHEEVCSDDCFDFVSARILSQPLRKGGSHHCKIRENTRKEGEDAR